MGAVCQGPAKSDPTPALPVDGEGDASFPPLTGGLRGSELLRVRS